MSGTSVPGSTGLGDELGGRLRAARIAGGLSVREAADRVGIGAGWLSTLEGGGRSPSLPVAEALVDVLALDGATAAELRDRAAPDPKGYNATRAERLRARIGRREREASRKRDAVATLRAEVAEGLRRLAVDVDLGREDRRLYGLRALVKRSARR